MYVYIGTANANRFLKRTFFHSGVTKCEEQKREAREDYGRLSICCFFKSFFYFFLLEERCEPSNPIYRNTDTRRFCPDINKWKEFDQYEIGNGFAGKNPTSTVRYSDRDRYNNIHRDRDMGPPPIIPDGKNDYET